MPSGLELAQQPVQLFGQLPQLLAGDTGLLCRAGALLCEPGRLGDVLVDVLDDVRLLQRGAGDGGIER